MITSFSNIIFDQIIRVATWPGFSDLVDFARQSLLINLVTFEKMKNTWEEILFIVGALSGLSITKLRIWKQKIDDEKSSFYTPLESPWKFPVPLILAAFNGNLLESSYTLIYLNYLYKFCWLGFWFKHMCQVYSLVLRKTAWAISLNNQYIEIVMSGILPLI